MHADGMLNTDGMLNAIERWAEPKQWLVRETIMAVHGRIDGILVPAWFDAPVTRGQHGGWTGKLGLLGVEVKASRTDFLRGLREEQFDRYDRTLAGLYVATPRSVKTAEIPAGLGHLICYQPPGEPTFFGDGRRKPSRAELRCVCRRHVTVRDWEMDPDTMWRLIFFVVKRARAAEIAAQQRNRETLRRIGELAADRVFAALKRSLEGIKP